MGEGGVTSAHVRPALISSISALGVAVEFLRKTEEKLVCPVVPLLFETLPAGSVPPREDGLTHKELISGEAPFKSCFTTTRYDVPKLRSVAKSVTVGVPPELFVIPSLKLAPVFTLLIFNLAYKALTDEPAEPPKPAK